MKTLASAIVETTCKAEDLTTQTVDLTGKTVLITGGTTGIGCATALLLASKGAKLLIFSKSETILQDAIQEIGKVGSVIGLTADTTKTEDIKKIFETVDREFGGLDILVANTALGAETIAEMSLEDQENILKTNLLWYLGIAQEAVDRMKSKGGHIVVVGSMSPTPRVAGSSVYGAARSGIEGFASALRREVNEAGIKVTLIEPGHVCLTIHGLPLEKEGLQLKSEDIAEVILFALTRPKRVDVTEMRVLPHLQHS